MLRQRLHKAGIFAQGSEELTLYERRLTRYFSREYRALTTNPVLLTEALIQTDQGPMWDQTGPLMEEHFDAPFELFRGFLDKRYLAYTMAYYGERPESILGSHATLEQAQRAKLELICIRAEIGENERVLNIGCGFGPLETHLAECHPGCNITSITPSRVQSDYIKRCQNDPSHPLYGCKLDLITDDFGSVEPARIGVGEYDLVFAVGAFEHVHNLKLAFEKIALMLKPGGRLFLHLIVSNPLLPHYHDSDKTLIGRFFPGGHIWPKSIIECQTGHFQLQRSWYLNGLNYWRTLDAWHLRYWQSIERLQGSVLDERQIRHWNDYFVLSKVVLFAPCNGEIYGNGQFLFTRPT
ncbi:MAG: class I SAM-dependent methyltransferase [Gammaproteobacteria bacterium]|nr:class I SAM-dependent methyltransferase [Gammaproteobacteria bacterium]